MENIWDSDDVMHISIADSFRDDKAFNQQFHHEYYLRSAEQIMDDYSPLPHPFPNSGPLFPMLLGSFYDLLSTEQENLYFHGSIFNNLVSSVFIALFFLLIRKYFGIKIGILSTILVSTIPYFGWTSTRILLYPLMSVFLISALFFLDKTKSNYIIFGIFAALAHLTHPVAGLLPLSYSIFLLLNKELKGFFITIFTWNLILIPWFIRSFYEFGDFGRGLYLPFSQQISNTIISLLSPHTIIEEHGLFPTSIIPSSGISYGPFSIFNVTMWDFTVTYNMTILLFFVIAFAGFAFFKSHELKKHFKLVLLSITSFVILYGLLFNLMDKQSNVDLQIIIIFLIPVLVITFLYFKKKFIFEKPFPRIYLFTILYSFISLVGLYYLTILLDYPILGSRFFMLPLFLLIPIFIIGLHKIIKQILKEWKIQHQKFIYLIIFSLVFVPISIQSGFGLSALNQTDWYVPDKHKTDNINLFITENVPSDKIIASNHPSHTWLKTGRMTVPLPTSLTSQESFEQYLNKFDVSYLVVYEQVSNRHQYDNFSFKPLIKTLLDWNPQNYFFTPIGIESYTIIKVDDVLNSDISNPTAYLVKSIKLEKSGKIEEATKIYNELRNYESNDKFIEEEICKSFASYEFFDEAIYKCNMLLKKDSVNLAALHNLVISFANTEQKDKVNEILDQYDKIIEESNDEQTLKSWGETVDYLIQFASSYNEIKNNLLLKIKTSDEQGDLLRALRIKEQIEYVDALSLDAHELKIRVLTKLEKYEDVLVTYDSAIEIYKNKIKKLNNEGFFEQANNMEKSLINLMKAKGVLLINLEDFHKANWVYLEILGIYKFDPDVYKKIAVYNEKYGQLGQALQSYEWALNLQPENDFLIEKIKELKDKIAD